MTKRIVWEHISNEDYKSDNDEPLVDDDDEEYSDEEYDQMEAHQLINTPFGLFSVKDNFNPLKQFVWWLGHTNFNIGPNRALIISETPGVEYIKVISRYRFMIAVGKAFEFTEVRKSIEENLQIIVNNIRENEDLVGELNDKHEKWAILYLNDGTYMTTVDEEYDKDIAGFQEYLKDNKGKLVTYNDV